jgi:non-heme chloroperoxidase
MEHAKVNAIELGYEVVGSGEPMLLIHGAHIADALQPLVAEPALERFQRIRYHRRGLGGSTRPVDAEPTSVPLQAEDAVGLLDHLRVDRTHMVGHSLGGAIALEFAAQHPTRVASLVLLEPMFPTAPAGAAFGRAMAPLVDRTKPARPRAPCMASWHWSVTATGAPPSNRPYRAGSRRPSRTPRPSSRQSCRIDVDLRADQAVPEHARRRVPAGGLRPARPRHVRGAARARHYSDGQLWADDLAAIIEQLRLDRPVLVGWSYGGFIICDYVRAHGQDRIAAIDFVAGAVKLGEAAFGTLIGPGFLDHFADVTADDLPTNVRGMCGLVKAFPAKPFPPEEAETLLCSSMAVPARIRANLGAREIDGDDVLRTLQVPLLVTQGRADTVVLPAMAEHVLATCPTAEASWYEGVGHTPHLEDPDRFNRELAALTRRAPA